MTRIEYFTVATGILMVAWGIWMLILSSGVRYWAKKTAEGQSQLLGALSALRQAQAAAETRAAERHAETLRAYAALGKIMGGEKAGKVELELQADVDNGV